jgi:hypothetical protein
MMKSKLAGSLALVVSLVGCAAETDDGGNGDRDDVKRLEPAVTEADVLDLEPGDAIGMHLSNAYAVTLGAATCECTNKDIEPVFCQTALADQKAGVPERQEWYQRDGELALATKDLLLKGRVNKDGSWVVGQAEAPNTEVALLMRVDGRISPQGVIEGRSAITANIGTGQFCNVTAALTGVPLWAKVDTKALPAADGKGTAFGGPQLLQTSDPVCGCADPAVAAAFCAELSQFDSLLRQESTLVTHEGGDVSLNLQGKEIRGKVSETGAFAVVDGADGVLSLRIAGAFDAPGADGGLSGLIEVSVDDLDCAVRAGLAGLRM